MAFHINLLPYLNTLTADHTGNKGTVMRMEGTELRLDTNQWVTTTFLPKICNTFPTWITNWARKQWQLVLLKTCILTNYTQPQAEAHNFHTEKIPALRIPPLHAKTRTRPQKVHFRVTVTHCLPYRTMKELFQWCIYARPVEQTVPQMLWHLNASQLYTLLSRLNIFSHSCDLQLWLCKISYIAVLHHDFFKNKYTLLCH